jgi:hypothetical protein
MSTMIDWIMLVGEKVVGGDNLTFEFVTHVLIIMLKSDVYDRLLVVVQAFFN